MTAQIHRGPQVDSSATKQSAQLIFDVRQAKEPDMSVRPEFNQDVNIAGFGKTIGKNRAEESQLTDTVKLAYLSDLRLRDLEVRDRHALSVWLMPTAVVPWAVALAPPVSTGFGLSWTPVASFWHVEKR